MNPFPNNIPDKDKEKFSVLWGLVVFLAAQPRQRMRYRPLIRRLVDLFGSDDPDYARHRIRKLFRELEGWNVVRLESPSSQITSVSLRKSGGRRLLTSFSIQLAIEDFRTNTSEGIKRLASKLHVHERTVWKWKLKEATPGWDYVFDIYFQSRPDDTNFFEWAQLFQNLRWDTYEEIFTDLELTDPEKERALGWLMSNHYNPMKNGFMNWLANQPDLATKALDQFRLWNETVRRLEERAIPLIEQGLTRKEAAQKILGDMFAELPPKEIKR
jgi:hypothetical protein